jgi:hypothetical protein
MSRLALVTLATVLGACASGHPKPVAAAPSPATASCPGYVVDGVLLSSACASPAKAEPAKCDDKGPLYVVDGVIVGCAKPEKD